MIPCILHIDNKIYHFRDISLLWSYLYNEYKNIRYFKPGEKTLIVRKGQEPYVIWYELEGGINER